MAPPPVAQVQLHEVSLWVVASTVMAVALAAAFWPGGRRATPSDDVPFDPWSGRLTRSQIALRGGSVVILLLAVAAGRLGNVDQLRNLAPSLVVGSAWPALIFVSAAGGPAWRWLDPWDGVARALGSDEGGPTVATDVRWAAIPAGLWAWYLSVYPDPLAPRSVGLALAVYSIAMVAGALAAGRLRWLPRVEVFGLLFSWLARLPRGALDGWSPPRGVETVLGILAGGLLFGLVRRSEVWGELNVVPGAAVWATLAFAGSALAAWALLWGCSRWADRQGAAGSVVAAAVPAVGAVALAVAMASSRVFTAVQLLPILASDPFGRGWDLFGTAGLGIEAPLGPTRLAAVQLATLVLGHIAGAVVLARRAPAGRAPGTVALVGIVLAGSVAVLLAPGA